MSKAKSYTITFKSGVTFNPDLLRSFMHKQGWDEKYGEVLGSVQIKELELKVLPKGSFGLIIDGPWKGYKVKITGYRGQVLPRTTQYVYECKSYNINDIPNFNKVELAVPIEDVVPYTAANKLLYG